MAWNLSANKQEHNRERFAGPLSIAGLVGAGLLLLVVLYPEKSLLRLLSVPEVSSPAQQSYLEALVRLRNGEADLVIPLVRSYLSAGRTDEADRALGRQQGMLSKEQARTIATLRYELRRQQLEQAKAGISTWEPARQQYADMVEQLQQVGATAQELGRYLADARKLGDSITVRRLEGLLGVTGYNGDEPEFAEGIAVIALGRGDYRGAAAAYFKGMPIASPEQKRKLFLAGVKALQSGNLSREALAAAEQHLTAELGRDRVVLIYLTRLALAANQPEQAQRYIRRALGAPSVQSGGATP